MKYAGKVAILNDSLLTPGWVAGYLKASGQLEIARTDNLTRGLAEMCRRELARTPGMLVRLRRSTREYRKALTARLY